MKSKEQRQRDAAVAEFVAAFETVFGDDWEYTKSMLGIVPDPEGDALCTKMIGDALGEPNPTIRHDVSPDGTFIDPKIDDIVEDWGNRARLLDAYRALKQLLAPNQERDGVQ